MSWNIKTPGDYINGPLTVAGSATITGAATVGTTLGVTGASTLTGSVGIGAASSAKLSVADANGIPIRFGDLSAAPASQTACFVGVSTTSFVGNGNGDLILVPRTTDNRDVVVYTGSGTAAERFRVTAAGNVNITTGNVVMATSGKGIDFSAVTGGTGTATANVLNDYEEGTWSPTPSENVNLTSVVSVSARYTKVGRLVTLSGQVTATVTSPNILTYFILPTLPFANGTVTTGAVQENGNLTVGAIQVSASNLYGFFPAASALVSGAATFHYSVTYSV